MLTWWRIRRVWLPVSALLLATVVGLAGAQRGSPAGTDWPQWRGPNRDGSIAGFIAPAAWPEQLVARWKVDVGLGYATPLVVGNRLYMFARQGEDEVMSALDPATGAVIWKAAYPAPFTMNKSAARH